MLSAADIRDSFFDEEVSLMSTADRYAGFYWLTRRRHATKTAEIETSIGKGSQIVKCITE